MRLFGKLSCRGLYRKSFLKCCYQNRHYSPPTPSFMKLSSCLFLLLAVSPVAAVAQMFYLISSSYAYADVTPLPSGSSGDNQSSGDGLFYDSTVDSHTTALNSSNAARFIADGLSARGTATSAAFASSSLLGVTINGTSSTSYPQQAPNSAIGSTFLGYGAYSYSGASASFVIFDVVVSGPESATFGSVNLNVGSMLNTSAGILLLDRFGNSLPQVNDGDYSTTIPGLFTSGNFVLPVGQPFRLQVYLNGSQAANSRYGDPDQSVAFSGSARLPLGGEIFNLPAGFTANSTGSLISDNRFTAVPEPSEYAMMGAFGLLGLAAARRHFVRKAA